jgi:hypothetical protein
MAIYKLSRKDGVTALLEKYRSIELECGVAGCIGIKLSGSRGTAMLTRVWVQ